MVRFSLTIQHIQLNVRQGSSNHMHLVNQVAPVIKTHAISKLAVEAECVPVLCNRGHSSVIFAGAEKTTGQGAIIILHHLPIRPTGIQSTRASYFWIIKHNLTSALKRTNHPTAI